jgi:diguanylate cyclase (GGDEF)-like protein
MTAETVRRNKAGERVEVNLQMAPLLVDGTRAGYVFTFRDVANCHPADADLQHDAMHDALTGLPNRALFLDHVNLALSRRERHPQVTCGVLSLNLDRFKEVNDALGHPAGDALLKEAAERLRHALRPEDSAARLGGDEFAALVEDIATPRDLELVAARVLREITRPFEIFGHRVICGASIGGVVAGFEYQEPVALVGDASQAMYFAKHAGGGRCEMFGEPLEVSALAERSV